MITVNLNRTEFEYDIHSLLKAFFPKEDVEIYYTAEAHADEKNVACTNHSVAAGNEDETNRKSGHRSHRADDDADRKQISHFTIDYADDRS